MSTVDEEFVDTIASVVSSRPYHGASAFVIPLQYRHLYESRRHLKMCDIAVASWPYHCASALEFL